MSTSPLASACLDYYRDMLSNAIIAINAFKDDVVSFVVAHLQTLVEAVSTFVVSATAFVITQAIVPAGLETPVLALPAYALFFPAVVDAARSMLTYYLAKTLPLFIARHMADLVVLQLATFQNWTYLIFGALVVGHLVIVLIKYLYNLLWVTV